jgi:hypothetical protein
VPAEGTGAELLARLRRRGRWGSPGARGGGLMATTNFAMRRYVAEIVYCGPGLGGKTTTLEQIASQLPGATLVREDTEGERTVFFDLLPLSGAARLRGGRSSTT